MKLSSMLTAITDIHTTAKNTLDTARLGFCYRMGSAHLTDYADMLCRYYEMACDYAKAHGTKSAKVWDMIRDIHGMVASARGYAADEATREAAL